MIFGLKQLLKFFNYPQCYAHEKLSESFKIVQTANYQEPYLIFWRSVVTSYGNLTLSKEEAEEMILSGMLISNSAGPFTFLDPCKIAF